MFNLILHKSNPRKINIFDSNFFNTWISLSRNIILDNKKAGIIIITY